MKRIAVIGGGIFGCHIASDLVKLGHEVSLFDKNAKLLTGTSSNNSRRVHLGLHYPRHFRTARQSKESSESFIHTYGDFLHHSFQNYYGIARDSRVSNTYYENFLNKLGIFGAKCSRDEIHIPGLKLNKLSGVYRSEESILLLEPLREYMSRNLEQLGVGINLNREVLDIAREGDSWKISFASESSYADFVILATHSQETFSINRNGKPVKYNILREFHVTQILIGHIPKIKSAGITILDGDYLTLLPVSESNEFSIYSPSASRLAVDVALKNPFDDKRFQQTISTASDELLQNKFYDWFEKEIELQPKESWFAIRNVPAHKQKTDERTSWVEQLDSSLLKVHSTKLVHCTSVSRMIQNLLRD